MEFRQALVIARRELRGSLRSFRILVVCLSLGVAAVTLVGIIQSSIENGLSEEGAIILGGDVELEFPYRYANPDELSWIQSKAVKVSEIVEFRSLAFVDKTSGSEKALTQVKGVDDLYPLYGEVMIDPPQSLEVALATIDGIPGGLMLETLVDRLDIAIGDKFFLGNNTFELRGIISNEPDNTGGGFTFGPRTLVKASALEGSGLLEEGTLFSSHYRLQVDPSTNLDMLRIEAEEILNKGFSWRDRRNGSPGIQATVERVGAFLTLVGLAGLVVGGIGISLAVSTYIETKTQIIATIKSLGANQRIVFTTYLFQIMVMIIIGVGAGIILGIVIPFVLASYISNALPIPFLFILDYWVLIESSFYGLLIGLIFSVYSLSQTDGVKPASLYRDLSAPFTRFPRVKYIVPIAILVIILVGTVSWASGAVQLTLYSSGGVLGTLIILGLASQITRFVSNTLGHSRIIRGFTALSLAFRSIGGNNKGVISLTIALGLGLAVLASIGQISNNLLRSLSSNIPANAPSYFVVDIQNEDVEDFISLVSSYDGVEKLELAPMLRGIITEINGKPAREVAGDHWVLEGDRGVTYSEVQPENTITTSGNWWPANYTGPALVSFAEEEGKELGLELGDRITLNILGRNLEAEIINFRSVDFSTVGIGFILSLNPSAIRHAPHTHIATIYSDEQTEKILFKDLTDKYRNITMISVSEGIANVSRILSGLGTAIIYSSSVTLLVGFVVLIGASASSVSARAYEAAILKVLGSSRMLLIKTFIIRSLLLGASAGIVAIFAGVVGGWSVMTFVLESPYRFEPLSAITIVVSGAIFSLLSGMIYLVKLTNTKPNTVLNHQG